MWVAFANAKATHIFFFSKNISVYAIFNDQRFNDTLVLNNWAQISNIKIDVQTKRNHDRENIN